MWWNMQIWMEMSRICWFIVSSRELYVDSVGTDSSKCRRRLKRPANVNWYVDGDSSSKCRPDMFDICTNPYFSHWMMCLSLLSLAGWISSPPSHSKHLGRLWGCEGWLGVQNGSNWTLIHSHCCNVITHAHKVGGRWLHVRTVRAPTEGWYFRTSHLDQHLIPHSHHQSSSTTSS